MSNSLVISTTNETEVAGAATQMDEDELKKIVDKRKEMRDQSGLVGLALGGVVVSQQADSFSQADPFFRIHYRIFRAFYP